MKTYKKRSQQKVRTGVKWMIVLVAVLTISAAIEYIRLEVSSAAVTVTAPFRPQYSANEVPESSIALVKQLTGIDIFSERYGTTGAGQKIAIIDSGIDLYHEAFRRDIRKVNAYYDYTDEGILYTEAAQQNGDKLSLGGTLYRIGGIYNQADCFYMTFLNLDMLAPQILAGFPTQIAILVTSVYDGYDCIYIDTNMNCDFTDEMPIYAYQNGGSGFSLRQAGYPINCVVSEIASDGRKIQISADTLGHGTFLASIIAANGEAYQGIAPQAELYVYKIFDKNGSSSQQKLADAIVQAVQDDVDCINLSLSIPKNELVFPALKEALRLAWEVGIPVIAAAGNYGPGKNTLAYPAREPGVIGVGSVAYPSQYLLDKAVFLEDCFIPDYSGRGSMDGNTAPLVVAPSGVIAAVPGWYTEQYMYDYGTSISAAIVTGAVSHLQESAKKGCMFDETELTPDMIMKILSIWAEDLSVSGCEQGYGALQLGILPIQQDQLSLPKHNAVSPTIYWLDGLIKQNNEKHTAKKELCWQYDVPQGHSQAWYLVMPKDIKSLRISLAVNTDSPRTPFEHLIAMGRCRLYLYNPDGELVEATDYIGAAYGVGVEHCTDVSVWHPQEGTWELVVTSADNLSLYNHFASAGMIYVQIE